MGIEWAFAGNWSARAEYDFIGLQNRSITVVAPGSPFAGDTINFNNRNIILLTVGLNYRFGGWWDTNLSSIICFLGRRAAEPSFLADMGSDPFVR